MPDMEDLVKFPSGKTNWIFGEIEFSCTTAGGAELKLTLIVSVLNTNDNKATFVGKTEYEATIPELARPEVLLDFGDIVLKDTDRLLDQLTYNLLTEEAVPFEVSHMADSFNADGIIEFQVKVKNPPAVDFERNRQYNLTLAVTDAQDGVFKDHISSVTLIITVEDLDDNDPVFDHLNYAATIEEGTVGQLTVMPADINAYDQDLDLNVDVTYSITDIVGDCPADSLEIDANTGIIIVNNTRLKAGQCVIELTARQVDDDQRRARATLSLTISDIDTSCPGFVVTELTGRVDPEDTFVYEADGVDKLLLKVTDDDATFSGNLTLHDLDEHPFRLATEGTEQGAPTLYFNVTGSPVLTINQTYNLQVTVSASGNCTVERASVEITVQNLAPRFNQERYDTEITEGDMSIDPIETVSAVSLGASNKISYFLKSSTNGGENFFEVDRNSGEIFLTSVEVDAEQVEEFILFIEAMDRSWEPSRVSFAYVFVAVNDSNDNAPVFQDTPYEEVIPESGYNDPIFTVKALDADASDVLQYSLLTENSPFKINNEGGLSVVGVLDVDNVTDSQSEYILVVSVSDGENDVSVNVTILVMDVNDNPPMFDEDDYVWELPEGEPLTNETFEVTVTDKDIDANITFSLEEGSDDRFQLLNSKIGEITVDGTFDRETKAEIMVVVLATDGEYTSETTVIVNITDINDNNPEFIVSSSTSLEVAENAAIGTSVFSFMVIDADEPGTDNTQIMLVIQDETDFGVKVADDGDGYQLFVNGTLDRETRETYEMSIVASNPGFPEVSATLNVTVTLLDVNDNAPEFLVTEEDIALETAATFDLIASLSVIDRDIEPNYFKFSSSGENSDLFFVSPTDEGCLVFLKSNLELSSERYILDITVWNPDSPELKGDHSTIRLRFFYGELPCFEIVPKDPEVTRVIPGDAEFVVLTMGVNVSDCSDPSAESDIMYNITRATYKKDLDTLYADDTDDVSINEMTGDLSLVSPSPGLYVVLVEAYNSSEGVVPSLTIRMYSTVEVRLTEVANNPPMFTAPEFTIPARILPVESGTELWDFGQNVTDADSPAFGNGELLFFIDGVECVGGCDASDVFNMTADGKLILAKDLTTVRTVNLTIRAQDRAEEPLNDKAHVSLGFRPASTGPPMFVDECETPILIQEESDEVDMLVCDLRAVSGDDLPVIYGFKGDEPGNFTINSATGEIFTTRAFDYDDSDRQFELLVFARTSDTSQETFTVVNVQIVDINDHAPEFLQDSYQFELDEDLNSACQNGSMLPGEWLVKATDDDSTLINQRVEYSIVGGSEDFTIDTTTGKISKQRCINAENYTSGVIMLIINATNPDAILQPMGSTSVSFVIRDLNDNAPIFDEASYVPVWVPYLMSDYLIKSVAAQDEDVSEYNSGVTYAFATDQDLNVYRYFTIGETTGEIRTTNVTGYNTEELFGDNNEIMIIVNARDNGSPPREADPQGIVAILYDPNNLNEPYFPEKDREQEISPPENAENWCDEFTPPYMSSSPEIIVLYSIIDVVPSNATLTFFLPENNQPKLCSSKSFDREQIGEYVITIKATSCNETEEDCSVSITRASLRDGAGRFSLDAVEANSGNADFSVVVITLRVEDISDATPEFDKDFIEGANKFIIAVPDNTPYGQIIFQAKATDDDAQSRLNYSIEYDDHSSTPNFVMDDLTGRLAIQDRVESYLSDVTFDLNEEQGAYDVTLKVNDDLTNQSYKASSEVEAKIKLLFIYEYAILVINKKPTDVSIESAALVECLSDELGLTLVVDSIEAHVILPRKVLFTYSPIEIDQKRTDVWVHMIDTKDGVKFVKYWDFKKLWDSNKGKSKCFSTDVTLRPPQPHSVVAEQFDESMIASFALLVMASFIGVCTVLMMVAILYMWHNVKLQGGRQISRRLDMLMLTENDQLSTQYSGVDNPGYEPDFVEEATTSIKEKDVKIDVGEQANLEDAGASAEPIEPTYANVPKVSIQALQSEPKSTLTKGPEHYESQEVVFDFPLEEESDTDTGVADFARIRTRAYPDNKEPSPDPASVEIVNEQPDKLDKADGDGAALMVSAEQQDKSDAQETTKDPTEAPSTETPTGDVAEEPVQDLCPLQPEDVSKELSKEQASVSELDSKQEAFDDLPLPPPPPPTPGEVSTDSEPATPKLDPKQATKELDDDIPLPPPPPEVLSNSNEKNKSTPSTPRSARSEGHSSSQSPSEGTPLTDFENGEIPDFLENIEITKL
ncbi:protocadherin Fat 4-like isoform X2 [Asterias amurensis]